MAKITDGVTDKEVLRLMEIFQESYSRSLNDLQRLEDMQAMYDNVINAATWPTTSKMPIPILFTSTERALAPAMDYLFPDSHFIRLIPADPGTDMNSIERTERALEYTVRSRVKLPYETIRTIKDCYKMSIGYGIIEPIMVQVPQVRRQRVRNGERVLADALRIVPGSNVKSVRYRYVSPGQVITTQDGVDFNGKDRPSVVFFIDFYRESELRALYDGQPSTGEDVPLKGNVNEIIKQARDNHFDSRVPIANMIGKLGGVDINITNKANQYIPVMVPVIKCYSENQHIWIANGKQIIYNEKDKYQTMRCNLVKASCWPDATRWYPMSSPEAGYRLGLGVNIFVNAMMDLLTKVVKPSLVYDKTMTGNKPPEQGPNSEIGVGGDVTKAARYLEAPQMPQGLFAVGDLIQRFYGSAIGQENFLTSPSAGLVRGGANAFESLLQSTTGREQLGGTILESGFIQPAVESILMFMQLGTDENGQLIVRRRYNKEQRKEYIEEMRLTPQDLMHVFDVSLSLRSKHKNSAIDAQTRQAEFATLKDDPYVDQYELRRRYVNDEEAFDRLIVPRERAGEIEEQRRQLLMAQEQGVEPTPEAQGMQGAAAIGGAQ